MVNISNDKKINIKIIFSLLFIMYKSKYLKYKHKYLKSKGGAVRNILTIDNLKLNKISYNPNNNPEIFLLTYKITDLDISSNLMGVAEFDPHPETNIEYESQIHYIVKYYTNTDDYDPSEHDGIHFINNMDFVNNPLPDQYIKKILLKKSIEDIVTNYLNNPEMPNYENKKILVNFINNYFEKKYPDDIPSPLINNVWILNKQIFNL